MLTLKIEVEGKTRGDLADGLRQVLERVPEGYLLGMDSNDTGRYWFDVTGRDESHDD